MSKASSKAYQAIREKILSGEFAPGARLTEEELADVCEVSRTPIRDALRALAAEYYVTIIPNHGTFVSKWSREDIEDIFQLRAMLEGYAARRAARRATADQLDVLRQQCNVIDVAIRRGAGPDIDSFLAANRRFHQTIMDAAGSERLSMMISRLIQQPVVDRTARSYDEADLKRSNRHHFELLDAISAGAGEWAESVMRAHILAAFDIFRREYEKLSATEQDAPQPGPKEPA